MGVGADRAPKHLPSPAAFSGSGSSPGGSLQRHTIEGIPRDLLGKMTYSERRAREQRLQSPQERAMAGEMRRASSAE